MKRSRKILPHGISCLVALLFLFYCAVAVQVIVTDDATESKLAWNVAAAVDSCVNLTECSSCLKATGCGWCGFPQQCKAGNASGDYQGTCYLSWVYGRPCPDCASYKNCSDCLKQDFLCGWCGPTQTCISPTYNKTDNRLEAPSCPEDFSNGMEVICPDCHRATTCRTCSALDDSAGRCGWCDARQQCIQGDRAGPYTFKDECSSWDYLRCTYCQLHESCYDCTLDPNCGWCNAGSGQCLLRKSSPFTFFPFIPFFFALLVLDISNSRSSILHPPLQTSIFLQSETITLSPVRRHGHRRRRSARILIPGVICNRVLRRASRSMWWI